MVDVEALQRENAALRARLDEVIASNAKLTHQLATLNDRVAELLAVAQRRQRKPPAEKPKAPPPDVSDNAKVAFDARPKPPDKPDEPKPAKKPSQPTGRKPVPSQDDRVHAVDREHFQRQAR